eukprot:10621235-Alexandrium_andersonii.AAC.1
MCRWSQRHIRSQISVSAGERGERKRCPRSRDLRPSRCQCGSTDGLRHPPHAMALRRRKSARGG